MGTGAEQRAADAHLVEPAANATSRSPLMPIEHTAQLEAVDEATDELEGGPRAVGVAVGRADRHQPVDAQPGVAPVGDEVGDVVGCSARLARLLRWCRPG